MALFRSSHVSQSIRQNATALHARSGLPIDRKQVSPSSLERTMAELSTQSTLDVLGFFSVLHVPPCDPGARMVSPDFW